MRVGSTIPGVVRIILSCLQLSRIISIVVLQVVRIVTAGICGESCVVIDQVSVKVGHRVFNRDRSC